jgi:hypothetical protein
MLSGLVPCRDTDIDEGAGGEGTEGDDWAHGERKGKNQKVLLRRIEVAIEGDERPGERVKVHGVRARRPQPRVVTGAEKAGGGERGRHKERHHGGREVESENEKKSERGGHRGEIDRRALKRGEAVEALGVVALGEGEKELTFGGLDGCLVVGRGEGRDGHVCNL